MGASSVTRTWVAIGWFAVLGALTPAGGWAENHPAAATAASAGEAAPPAATTAISGKSTFVVSDCTKDPITLLFTTATEPTAVRTREVVIDGATGPTPGWTLGFSKPVATDSSIHEYQTVGTFGGGCPPTGRYRVTVRVFTGAAGSTGDPLSFELERAADPVLRVLPSATLGVGRLPFQEGGLVPSHTIALKEESYSSPLTSITVQPAQLKNAGGEISDVRLEGPSAPVDLKPGGTADLQLALSGTPPPGVYSGQLVFHSPALRETVTSDITVKVRIYSVFLLFVLIAGVALGWLINTQLANAAKLNAALLQALRSADGIVRRAQMQKDPAVQQRLLRIATQLEAATRIETTADAIADDEKTALAAATDVETKATAAAKALLDDLAATHTLLSNKGAPLDPMIQNSLETALNQFESISRLAASGDVEECQRQLQLYKDALPQRAATALRPWLSLVNTALIGLGPWGASNQEPEATRAKLMTAIATAYSASDAGALILQSDGIAATLRSWTDLQIGSQVARIFQLTSAAFIDGKKPDLAAQLDDAANSVLQLALPDPIGRLNALAAIKRQVMAQLTLATPPGVDAQKFLDVGDFVGAAGVIAPKPPPAGVSAGLSAGLGLAQQAAGIVGRILDDQASGAAALLGPPVAALPPRVIVDPDLVVDQAAPVRLDWPEGPPAEVRIDWSVSPLDLARIEGAGREGGILIPGKPGGVTITASIEGGSVVSARAYIGAVIQAADSQDIQRRAECVNRIIWIATALLTTGVGYLTFEANWLGTATDFMSAFIWGFFGQFGLDRIRDLSKPILSKGLS